jgi:ribonuclease HII
MLKAKIHPGILECGTDEAGRGCLAGPVTAAAVILPEGFTHPWLNDSKKLSKARRNELRPLIEKEAVAYRVVHINVGQIDKINILNASILGMQQAVSGLQVRPEFIAVDGNRFKPLGDLPFKCVIKGDAKYLHIAAASILAKTYRDELMESLHSDYPDYNWKKNKGYPTAEHRIAIKKKGATPHHRSSFKLLPDQLKLAL